ncbi:MAG: peptidase [Chloroflexi bacterium B3_Chlor]|nr:MAG: peptidase [Chloroflexi bacterium B3_Chlor]
MLLPTNVHNMPIFDGHNDTLLSLHLRERGGGRSFLTRSEKGHLDLPRAREAGFGGGFFAIFVPSPTEDFSGPPDPTRITTTENGYEVKYADPIDFDYAYGFANEVVTSLFHLEEASEGAVKVVRRVEELVDCLSQNVLAVVLHFEGAEAIDPQLHNLEAFYHLGLRSLGITWSRPNAFGWGVPFRFPASPDIGPGLTEAGRELVRACNKLGIMLDLSHLNERGFGDVANLSDAPLVATHTAAHAVVPRTRNLTDEQLEAIGDSNGVVGVTFSIYDLHPHRRLEGDAPLTAVVRHIDYIAERIGIDHVAFGSDFDGATIPKEMGGVTGFPRLLALLREHGFDDDGLRKLTHENWIRVIRDTWHD